MAHASHGRRPALELAGKVLMIEKKVHGHSRLDAI
jgi:hypothetical protein